MLILIDVSCLAYRAYYALPNLSAGDLPSGIIYHMLDTILFLGKKFETNEFIFCFDGNNNIRKTIFPEYKAKRKQKDDDEETKKKKEVLYSQIEVLRKHVLPSIGFKNILRYNQYESDDVMAQLSMDLIEELIIVTTDADLYQCLSETTNIYNPMTHKLITPTMFMKKYEIPPWKWSWVKAYAGCKSDEVPGIPGIGEKTAIKYINNKLPEKSKKYIAIKENDELYCRNIKLVKLPYEPIKDIPTARDKFSKKGFMKICKEYEIGSFLEGDKLKDWKYFFLGTTKTKSVNQRIRQRLLT